jgi:ribosome maturation factor RimP
MRRTLIGILVILLNMPGAFPSPRVSAQDDVWAAVRNLPAGSRVRVTLHEGGTNVTGKLVELREDAVVMKENSADRTHAFKFAGASLRDAVPFARAEITRATLVEIVLPYRSDPPNAAVSRRVLSEFADGRFKPRLTVKYGTKTVRGTIADVGADDFAVKRERNDVVRVRYSELVSLSKPKINQAGWMAIGGAAGGLGAWAFCAALHCNQ